MTEATVALNTVTTVHCTTKGCDFEEQLVTRASDCLGCDCGMPCPLCLGRVTITAIIGYSKPEPGYNEITRAQFGMCEHDFEEDDRDPDPDTSWSLPAMNQPKPTVRMTINRSSYTDCPCCDGTGEHGLPLAGPEFGHRYGLCNGYGTIHFPIRLDSNVRYRSCLLNLAETSICSR